MINILAVDDEEIALHCLVVSIKEALPTATINAFSCPEQAYDYSVANPCDIAFLDINMYGTDGICLAKKLKADNPLINIIFVTAHTSYAVEALSMYISGYVLKPVTKEKVELELKNLRHKEACGEKSRICIQCFGNFEIFGDGEPIKFLHSKTKELLAYLIDREGAFCSNAEIISVLWEDESEASLKSSYLRKLRGDLISVFHKYGVVGAIKTKRGFMAIIPDKIVCDYFSWVNSEVNSIKSYRGEYMAQYSWGEFTHGEIEMRSRK